VTYSTSSILHGGAAGLLGPWTLGLARLVGVGVVQRISQDTIYSIHTSQKHSTGTSEVPCVA
jgi:hypothetical protein